MLVVNNLISWIVFASVLGGIIGAFVIFGFLLSKATISNEYITHAGMGVEVKTITSIRIKEMSTWTQSSQGTQALNPQDESIFGKFILFIFVLIYSCVNWLLSLVFRKSDWTKSHRAIINYSFIDEETQEVITDSIGLNANGFAASVLEKLAKANGIPFMRLSKTTPLPEPEEAT